MNVLKWFFLNTAWCSQECEHGTHECVRHVGLMCKLTHYRLRGDRYTRLMDPTLRAVLGVSMRWIHITSVVTLMGGFIFARFALAPALATLAEPERGTLGKKVVGSFRPCCIPCW